jgi:hypothetical protein
MPALANAQASACPARLIQAYVPFAGASASDVILRRHASRAQAKKPARTPVQHMNQHFVIDEHAVSVGSSIGIAALRDGSTSDRESVNPD